MCFDGELGCQVSAFAKSNWDGIVFFTFSTLLYRLECFDLLLIPSVNDSESSCEMEFGK